MAPVLTSVETLLCTPELIARPTLGIVIPDSAKDSGANNALI